MSKKSTTQKQSKKIVSSAQSSSKTVVNKKLNELKSSLDSFTPKKSFSAFFADYKAVRSK